MNDNTTRAAALIAFAEYVKESRGLETVTEAQAQEIAEHWLRNIGTIEEAHKIGIELEKAHG